MKPCKTYKDNTNFQQITINNGSLFSEKKMSKHFHSDLVPLKLLEENFKEKINAISTFNFLLVVLMLL